jgi:ABC-type polar amino acid transport system ATPase subunit
MAAVQQGTSTQVGQQQQQQQCGVSGGGKGVLGKGLRCLQRLSRHSR